MKSKKLILSTILIWIAGIIFMWLTCGWLFSWVYTIPPLIWLSPEEMMSTNNMLLSNLSALMASFLFVMVYDILYKGIPGTGIKKGLTYGLLMWLVGALSGMVTMPFYMTIASTVIVYWVIQALVLNLLRGLIIGWIYK